MGATRAGVRVPLGRVCECHSGECAGATKTERASRFERGEQFASSGADRMNRFYRYNSVCCPLKVFLIGKLDEKASALSLRAGRVTRFGRGERLAPNGADRMNRFYRYNLVCCPLKVFLIGKLDEKLSAVSLRAGRTG